MRYEIKNRFSYGPFRRVVDLRIDLALPPKIVVHVDTGKPYPDVVGTIVILTVIGFGVWWIGFR